MSTETADDIAKQRREGDREYLLEAIGGPAALRRVKRGGWPGVPTGHIPLCVSATLRDLIAEGVVELIEVTRNSKVGPARRITYHYLAIAAARRPSDAEQPLTALRHELTAPDSSA